MRDVGAAIPGTRGGNAILLPIHLRGPGLAGTDVLAQDVPIVPGTTVSAFGFCFPPSAMPGHIVQHLVECKAHAVVLLPYVKAYWFSVVQRATVRSIMVAPVAATGCLQ